jgi:hypothetical protein
MRDGWPAAVFASVAFIREPLLAEGNGASLFWTYLEARVSVGLPSKRGCLPRDDVFVRVELTSLCRCRV